MRKGGLGRVGEGYWTVSVGIMREFVAAFVDTSNLSGCKIKK